MRTLLTVAALAAALAGCKPGATGTTGLDEDPTGKAWNKSTAGAVVESTNYSRGANKHTVICVVNPGDRVFEVTVPAEVAYRYLGGEPCPADAGPREWWPQDDEEVDG